MSFAPNPEVEAFIIMLQEAMRRAYASEDPAEVRAWLQRQLQVATPNESNALMGWLESFDLYRKILEERAERSMLPKHLRREFSWGWDSWSRNIDPPDEGALALIAGAPGTGKTIVAEHIGEANAKAGLWGLFFHFELSRKVMLDRRAVRQTLGRVDRGLLRKGLLTESQILRLTEESEGGRLNQEGIDWMRLSREARSELAETERLMKEWSGGMDYMHVPGWNVDQLVDAIQKEYEVRRESDYPLRFIVVDYLEKIAASPRQMKMYGQNSILREDDNIERLKSLAEQTGLTFVLFAQLSKAGRQSSGDLDGTEIKGTGAKTEKTNIVNIIQAEQGDGDEDGEATILKSNLVKNTMGRLGSWRQKRLGDRFDIVDLYEING